MGLLMVSGRPWRIRMSTDPGDIRTAPGGDRTAPGGSGRLLVGPVKTVRIMSVTSVKQYRSFFLSSRHCHSWRCCPPRGTGVVCYERHHNSKLDVRRRFQFATEVCLQAYIVHQSLGNHLNDMYSSARPQCDSGFGRNSSANEPSPSYSS